MRVLITGAHGFIGRHILAALLRAGHEPVAAVRPERARTPPPGAQTLACDLAADLDPALWQARLEGIDAVVNCAGILRETRAGDFDRIHRAAPLALAQAAVQAGVKRFVQISALGDPADGEFVASKHRGDAAILHSGVAAVVLRPSVVCSTRGSYGGTTLLRALAALPWIALPGAGEQRLQPLDADDLAAAVLAALERPQAVCQCLELGGPQAIALRDYLALWRRWLGLGRARFLAVPASVARAGAWLGERFGRGPLGLTMWRMLERGNVVSAPSLAHSCTVLDWSPVTLELALARHGASSADRLQARTALLQPLLRLTLAATFLASGAVGLALPPERVDALFVDAGLATAWSAPLALGGSLADLALGLWLLVTRRPRRVLAAMALLVLGYTAFIGLLLPAAWLDPFGGLLKNGLVLVAIALAAAGAERQ